MNLGAGGVAGRKHSPPRQGVSLTAPWDHALGPGTRKGLWWKWGEDGSPELRSRTLDIVHCTSLKKLRENKRNISESGKILCAPKLKRVIKTIYEKSFQKGNKTLQIFIETFGGFLRMEHLKATHYHKIEMYYY